LIILGKTLKIKLQLLSLSFFLKPLKTFVSLTTTRASCKMQ
jgi:hypothetical protein